MKFLDFDVNHGAPRKGSDDVTVLRRHRFAKVGLLFSVGFSGLLAPFILNR